MASLTDPIFRLLREALDSIVTHEDTAHAISLLDPVVSRFSNAKNQVGDFI